MATALLPSTLSFRGSLIRQVSRSSSVFSNTQKRVFVGCSAKKKIGFFDQILDYIEGSTALFLACIFIYLFWPQFLFLNPVLSIFPNRVHSQNQCARVLKVESHDVSLVVETVQIRCSAVWLRSKIRSITFGSLPVQEGLSYGNGMEHLIFFPRMGLVWMKRMRAKVLLLFLSVFVLFFFIKICAPLGIMNICKRSQMHKACIMSTSQ